MTWIGMEDNDNNDIINSVDARPMPKITDQMIDLLKELSKSRDKNGDYYSSCLKFVMSMENRKSYTLKQKNWMHDIFNDLTRKIDKLTAEVLFDGQKKITQNDIEKLLSPRSPSRTPINNPRNNPIHHQVYTYKRPTSEPQVDDLDLDDTPF